MNLAWQNIWRHPGSTLSGLMSLIIALGAAMALNPKLDLGLPPRWIALFVAWSGIAKLVYLALSKQPGREEANVNGQAQMRPATETPDKGTAVTPEAQ